MQIISPAHIVAQTQAEAVTGTPRLQSAPRKFEPEDFKAVLPKAAPASVETQSPANLQSRSDVATPAVPGRLVRPGSLLDIRV